VDHLEDGGGHLSLRGGDFGEMPPDLKYRQWDDEVPQYGTPSISPLSDLLFILFMCAVLQSPRDRTGYMQSWESRW
jgi:hypothetical protein